MPNILLEIVIPCYNESFSIKDLVVNCNQASLNSSVRFILVDNGSDDGTWNELIQQTGNSNNFKLHKVKSNKGYGNGIIEGLNLTEAKYVGWMHADLQTNPEDLIQIHEYLSALKTDQKIFIKGKRRSRANIDVFFSAGMSLFESIIFGKKMTEINAQPTIFTRALLNEFVNPPLDFMLDLYAYNKAISLGYQQKKFSVNFSQRKYGVSSWNKNVFSRIKFIYKTIRFSLILRFRNYGNN
jgi:glycosyltransferase involved in cell wall biosynthesis